MSEWKSAPAERAFEVLQRTAHLEEPVIVEVGVNKGAMAKIILRERPHIHYLMVDMWTHEGISKDRYKNTNDRNALRKKHEALKARDQVYQLRDKYPNVVILQGDSRLVGKLQEPQSADLVFIDADHSYEGVYEDIKAWGHVPKFWIGGHDYENNDPKFDFSGVAKAVHEHYDEVETGLNFTWWKCLSSVS